MPQEDRERLMNWRNRLGPQADLISKEATQRGRKIHKLIEAKLKGQILECPENLGEYWDRVQHTLNGIDKVKAIEEVVYHRDLQYAGRFDLVANWRGEFSIFDFKTSNKEKKREWLSEHFIQLAAYRGAWENLYNTEIQQGLIVVISPDNAQVFELETESLEQYWQEWLTRLEQYKML